MVELDPNVKLKELEEDTELRVVRWVRKRFCFVAEREDRSVRLWIYDGLSRREFENCGYPYEVAQEKWVSWFNILSSD